MKKILLATVLTGTLASASYAQQLPLFSQYYYNQFLYNPAFTGTGEMANAYLIHRSQWKDIPGSPTTYALTLDGPVKSNQIGLGFSLFNDQQDIFNRTGLYTSYSYRWKVNADHHLTFGLSAGVIDNKIDFSRTSAHDVNDPLLYNSNRRKITVDGNFGIGYFFKDLQVGISIPQILGNKVSYMESETNVYTTLKRHVIGSVSYKVMISEAQQIRFIPSVMTRYVKGAPFQFDVNANFDWKDMVRAGISYRFGYALGMNVGVKLNNNLIAGYTYEHVLSSIGAVSGGGHEIMLGYTFGGGRSGGGNDNAKISEMEKNLDEAQVRQDSLARELKKKDQEHTEEIEKLKTELESMKSGKSGSTDVKDTVNQGGSGSTNNKDVRSENVADYQDENGKQITPGYYVIMGSFKKKENAQKAKQTYESKPGYKPVIIYNKKREFYYVCVFYNLDEETAIDILEVLRKEQQDAWIFKMM